MNFSLSVLFIAVAFGACGAFNEYFGLKDDNIIETISEDIIKSHTGLDMDLTPENPDEDTYSIDIWSDDR